MANEQDKTPTTGSESDISKAQFQQQPPNQASQQQGETGQRQGQFETGQQDNAERSGDQASTGQTQSGSRPDEGLQGDTLAQQRSDIEGSSIGSQESGEAGSSFVGSQGQQDTSSQLIDEEDEDFGKDGQGAPEGK
jgi:hypothetical protein